MRVLGVPPLSPRDLASGVTALIRGGVLRPLLPSPSLLGLALEAPFLRPNLAVALALQAATQPDEMAVIDDRGSLTWAQLDQRVNRLSNVLLDHGEPDDCVAFMVRNGREAVECYAAGGRSGVVPVPLHTSATAGELGRIVHSQRPVLVIADEEFGPVLGRALRHLTDPPEVVLVGGEGGYEAALAAALSTAPFTRGTAKIVIHTSGTTGAPKGAERNMGPSQIGALLGFAAKVPLGRGDRILISAPLFHSFGSGIMGAACVFGATSVLSRTFDPARFDVQVREHDVSATALVPVMLRRVLDQPAQRNDRASGPTPLRIVVTSGAALSAPLRQDAQARWGPVVYDLYGSTEAGWVSIATPDDVARRPGTVGRPGPGMTVRVVDDTGTPVATGQIGSLLVTTGMEFAGYTGGTAHRGAWDMGDLGYLDEDGYLYVTGRRDEMIVSGGENVHPSEIEAELDSLPGVAESAVVGVENEEYGQVLWAYVVGDVDRDEVGVALRQRLSGYKVPKRIVAVDSLPRTATGKVIKRRLVQAEHPSRSSPRDGHPRIPAAPRRN